MYEQQRLLAAGSLSLAFTPLTSVYRRRIEARFGPSGLLCAEIEAGADWDVFASADTGHPERLHRAGWGTPPRIFCRNALTLILRPDLDGTVVDLLRRDDLRLGISTPGNDPSGDYALAALDLLGPGLGARALRLTGAPDLPRPPAGRNTYAWILTSGAADMVLTYRSNAVAARGDTPALRTRDLPESLQVRATYALTTRVGAGAAAEDLADLILSAPVQERLQTLGFEASPGPQETTAEGCSP